MAIFLLKNEFGDYKNIKPNKQDDQRYLVDNYGHSMLNGWNPINFIWDLEDGEKPRDMFLYLGSILVGNKKSVSSLKQIISNDQCEFLPIIIEKEEFYVINICEYLRGALDMKKSKIEYFNDKSIKWISKFVFSSDCGVPSMFHIAEMTSPIFVSDSIAELVKNSGLIGLKFEECKQNKQSI